MPTAGHDVTLSQTQLSDRLQQTILFRGLSTESRQRIAQSMSLQRYPADTDVIRQGDESDALYLIVEGHCVVLLEDSHLGIQQEIAELVEYDVFGEMGLLVADTRSATVRTTKPTLCAILRRNDFNATIMSAPQVGLTMSQNLAMRLQAQSRHSGYRFVQLADYLFDPELYALFPAALLQRHQAVPLARDGDIVIVAMTRPGDVSIFADLKRVAPGVRLRPYACGLEDYERYFRTVIVPAVGEARDEDIGTDDFTSADVDLSGGGPGEAVEPAVIRGAQVVKLLDEILAAAVNRAASDIHVEPGIGGSRVRFRISGQLRKFVDVPREFHAALVSRIKIVSNIDIAEKRRPQDGRFRVTLKNRSVDLRVSTVPSLHGEKVVMRLLDSTRGLKPLDELIFADPLVNTVRQAILATQGCVVVCGPTGSGKTTTLYSALTELQARSSDVNISTIEDPIEYTLPGITQTNVNDTIDVGFSQILRALMRQDPDVVMVGEMRDLTTAQIALEASLTGHLVLSTVHANSSADAVVRLIEMGCKHYLVASSLSLVVGQRLVRRVCPHCKERHSYNDSTRKHLAAAEILPVASSLKLWRGRGCGQCGGSGWLGRVAIFEVLRITDRVREAVAQGELSATIRKLAIEDRAFTSFKQYGAYLLQEGFTTPAEVLRQFGS